MPQASRHVTDRIVAPPYRASMALRRDVTSCSAGRTEKAQCLAAELADRDDA